MGRRRGVYVHKRKQYKGPPPPNQTPDVISVEIRVFYPPNATQQAIALVLLDAANDAADKIAADALGPRLPGNVWLVPPPEWDAGG